MSGNQIQIHQPRLIEITVLSTAFQILSDPDKRRDFDNGIDPTSRFASASSRPSPFSRSARSASGARGPMFEDEISPEELFQRFFGGGMGGGGFGGGFGPFGLSCGIVLMLSQ